MHYSIHFKVIGQVDSKFIATVVKDKKHGELLVLLDQHAVDERIQLEKLIAGDLLCKHL